MDEQHSLSELNNRISYFQNLISSSSKSHPRYIYGVAELAHARLERYKLSKQQDDLDRSILEYMKAIFVPCPWLDNLKFLLIFWNLTVALSIRAEELKQPEDVKCCIIFYRYLHNQSHGIIPDVTSAYFVDALLVKMELELGDVREDIEEIADLCHKRLNSDISMSSQKTFLRSLERVVAALFGRGRRWEEDKIIQCLQEANRRLPEHKPFFMLGYSLCYRFIETHSIDDYEEGTSILDEVVAFRAGDTPSPYKEEALKLAASTAKARFDVSGKPDHLEEAIYRSRNLLDVLPPGHIDRPFASDMHSSFQITRGLDQVGIGGSDFDSPSQPSFRDLTTSLAQSNMGTSSMSEQLYVVSRATSLTNISEIEDAIKYYRQLLASPLGGQTELIASEGFGAVLILAFWYTNKIEYLNEALSHYRDVIQHRDAHGMRAWLIECLTMRFELLHHREDLNEVMQQFPIAVDDIRATTPNRFELSCRWACLARISRHPSTPTAYDHAISLMQATLAFSPTLHSQHLRLVAMSNGYERLPLDHASYLIHRGQLKKAIETLERGRCLMWSEMRGFRTSIDKIRTADLGLADKFAAVNRELEMLTLTSGNDLNGRGDGIKKMGPYSDLVVRQQRLLDDREILISQIQALSGFENFLTPPSFDTLRSAALHGPVIITSHCQWRSDILILLHDSPPSLVQTSGDFYGRANKLRDRLLGARKNGLESKDYEDALNSVLEELYELVGLPVIKRLNELHIPEQSRVWLCPTSAFCSLPLHAMGPIPSDDGSMRYFMDLYIPSYIPSLAALIESRKPDSQTVEKPSILLVVQPDEYMSEALREMKVVRAVNTQVTTLFSARAKPTATSVLKHLRDHRFAHIVCHGILEVGKPFEASFKLYGGERLSLLDIVRSQLPNAEFAFLSACHTAELTEESLADEGLHLTAAMQYCGFRSVVGTMWAMADVDGRELARDFYKLVFADKDESQGRGVRHYERTAEALRDAVQRLRRKGGITSERWVNFVHYGA